MERNGAATLRPGYDPGRHRGDQSFDSSGQVPTEAPWGTARKLALRFVFCYLLLYVFPLSTTFGWLWYGIPKLMLAYEGLWHRIVPWVGAHVLHLSYPITIFPEVNGGSDTTYDYLKSLCFLDGSRQFSIQRPHVPEPTARVLKRCVR